MLLSTNIKSHSFNWLFFGIWPWIKSGNLLCSFRRHIGCQEQLKGPRSRVTCNLQTDFWMSLLLVRLFCPQAFTSMKNNECIFKSFDKYKCVVPCVAAEKQWKLKWGLFVCYKLQHGRWLSIPVNGVLFESCSLLSRQMPRLAEGLSLSLGSGSIVLDQSLETSKRRNISISAGYWRR